MALILVWSSSLKTCNARQGKQYRMPSKYVPTWMGTNYNIGQEKISGGNTAIFNVMDYGAKGDGRADDTKVS
ncbi:Pectin lyase fold containing protein [Trema orientale]|uniref:Pectin lyase fold containing protein n=1 Tax=Trema orientale TaxID=63057 RepID=A0A2P5EFB0_TREOI|nr:Pectin lyase fold containing protein [Trema orientale]